MCIGAIRTGRASVRTRAMADCTQTLHLDPQHADAYRARADLYDQLQDATHAYADRARAEQLRDK